jgi:hypothetical protein
MEGVRPIVRWDLILFAVQGKPPLGDPVTVSADDGPEIRAIFEVILQLSKPSTTSPNLPFLSGTIIDWTIPL